jgi:hypothetical protein
VKRPFQMFLKNIANKQEGREYRHTVISYYLLQFFQIINLSTVIIRARILGKMDYFYFLRHMYETCL